MGTSQSTSIYEYWYGRYRYILRVYGKYLSLLSSILLTSIYLCILYIQPSFFFSHNVDPPFSFDHCFDPLALFRPLIVVHCKSLYALHISPVGCASTYHVCAGTGADRGSQTYIKVTNKTRPDHKGKKETVKGKVGLVLCAADSRLNKALAYLGT